MGNTLNWVSKWLLNRRQQVLVNSTCSYSDWILVSSSVPQGSVLGPTLFLIFINDLDSGLISKLAKFPDDSKLFKSVQNSCEASKLQDDLDRLFEWS